MKNKKVIFLFVISCIYCLSACTSGKTATKTKSRSILHQNSKVKGSFIYSRKEIDLTKHILHYFSSFIKKHQLNSQSEGYYENKYAVLRIWPSDHQQISVAFQCKNTNKWYTIAKYIGDTQNSQKIASWQAHAHEYEFATLNELAKAYIQFYAGITHEYLDAPFVGNCIWKKK